MYSIVYLKDMINQRYRKNDFERSSARYTIIINYSDKNVETFNKI